MKSKQNSKTKIQFNRGRPNIESPKVPEMVSASDKDNNHKQSKADQPKKRKP